MNFGDNLIICNKIFKKLGSKEILNSFSYTFSIDEAYAITGANGSGKTTLLRLIGGLLLPDSGEVKSEGSLAWFAFHSISLMDRLSGLDQINIYKKELFDSKEQTDKLSLWSSLEGFKEMLTTDLGHCSQGMKALLGLYISTLSAPDTLLWDEPFSCLSPYNQKYFLKNWKSLTGAKTLIMTYHGERLPEFIEVTL